MLAGVDFSERAAPADLGRLVRTLLDADRRGVPGRGAIMLSDPPPVWCAQSGLCLKARRVEDLGVRWKDAGRVKGESHRK
jgi:hypothetical protein